MPSGACLANCRSASPQSGRPRVHEIYEYRDSEWCAVLHWVEQVSLLVVCAAATRYDVALLYSRLAAARTRPRQASLFAASTKQRHLAEPSVRRSLPGRRSLVCRVAVTCATPALSSVVPAATTQVTAGCGGRCARMRCRAGV